jgi:predicted PurR-regulated permease PerM
VVLGILVAVFLDALVAQASAFVRQLPGSFADLQAWVAGLAIPDPLKNALLAWLDSIRLAALDFDISALVTPLLSTAGRLLDSFFTILVLPFFVFFLLAGRPGLQRSVEASSRTRDARTPGRSPGS